MSQSTGPRLLYPCEAVAACIAHQGTFSLENRFSTVVDEDERCWQLRIFCTPLLDAVQLRENHFLALNAHFTTLLPKALNRQPGTLSSDEALPPFQENQLVRDILRRLPSLPQRLFALPFVNTGARGTLWDGIRDGGWAEKFVLPDARLQVGQQTLNDVEYDPATIMKQLSDMQDRVWANLYVTTFIDTNSVVLAIKIAQEGTANLIFAREFLQYINALADLIGEFESLNDAASLQFTQAFSDPSPSVQALREALFPKVDDGHKQGRDIIKVFLWTAWQRSVMLYFYYLLQVQLQQGYSPEWGSLFAVRGIQRLEELDSGAEINYICNWSFQILRASRSSLGLDFRTMLSRFESHFGERSGRCKQGSGLACQGDMPETCQRFIGSETKSQSKHTSSCDGHCEKIRWSEQSYRSVTGARAVYFDSNNSYLQYCEASPRTMAISHVWSHGQGGRPEHGINVCLHQQYCSLAKACDSDSYWIDSACIPREPQLRKEAIETINTVFATSKVVLISDMDLQSIDLSTPGIEKLETLLSILLVCDWNVRAWTMLEAIRGRNNVNILCNDSQMISLTDLVRTVLNEGAIDLAVLLGCAQHLLPSDPTAAISIEDAGFLISRRHASRSDDEVVIWGLLNSLPGEKSALNLWASQKCVRTGYLMSSASRLEAEGYHWAPSAPYIRPQIRTVALNNYPDSIIQQQQNYMVCYQAYDGQGSYIASRVDGGLQSKWLVQDMTGSLLNTYRENFCYKTPLGAGHPTQQEINPDLDEMVEVHEQPDTVLACNSIERLLSAGNAVRVVRPLAECGAVPYKGAMRRGESYGMIAAVCVLKPGSENWEWQGVYQWLDEIDDYRWRIESMVIG
ncbi:hypothetical protein F5882DRAFT_95054 [Hyaloscypha sp. PMI_1271]|nr:hypothetical protein F5882DRAFT_95054 [Hyaloscypha sp. PMI_1271]